MDRVVAEIGKAAANLSEKLAAPQPGTDNEDALLGALPFGHGEEKHLDFVPPGPAAA